MKEYSLVNPRGLKYGSTLRNVLENCTHSCVQENLELCIVDILLDGELTVGRVLLLLKH